MIDRKMSLGIVLSSAKGLLKMSIVTAIDYANLFQQFSVRRSPTGIRSSINTSVYPYGSGGVTTSNGSAFLKGIERGRRHGSSISFAYGECSSSGSHSGQWSRSFAISHKIFEKGHHLKAPPASPKVILNAQKARMVSVILHIIMHA